MKTSTFSFNCLILCCLVVSNTSVFAEQGDWLVRFRGIVVAPNDDSGLISLHTGGGATPLAGSGVGVGNSFTPEVDITYMLRKNWGIEIIAAITNHDVSVEGPGAVLSGLGLTDGFDIFDTYVLPPTVTLQYHFMPENKIRPYVGLGVNFTNFFGDDATDALEAAIGPVTVTTKNSWGWSAQIGADFDYKDNWYFNVDLKFIDINTTANLNTAVGNLLVDVDIDPFVIGAGFGYKF